MIAGEEELYDILMAVGNDLDDAELDQRVAKFQDALRRMRDNAQQADPDGRPLSWLVRIVLISVLASWLTCIPRRIGDRLLTVNDAEAYWHDWQITKTYGGLARIYRDRRFDLLAECPKCHGAGGMANLPCPPCLGTGRVTRKKPTSQAEHVSDVQLRSDPEIPIFPGMGRQDRQGDRHAGDVRGVLRHSATYRQGDADQDGSIKAGTGEDG